MLRKTRQDYNLIAEDFARTRSKPWPEIKFLFDDYLRPGERVLDLGCGQGRFFEFCENKNIDYWGVDFSEKLIEIAKARYRRAKFRTTDGLNLPFSEDYFDRVFSIAVFHHIPSVSLRLRFLLEAKRVLKPGGFLILTVWKLHRLKELFLIFKFAVLRRLGLSKLEFNDILKPWGKKVKKYYHCFSEKELINVVEKAGFRIKKSGVVKNKKGSRRNIYLVAQKVPVA